MNPQQTLEHLANARVIPVLRTTETRTARAAAFGVLDAGFLTVELTLSIPDCAALIAELKAEGYASIGAGTVLSTNDCERVLDAGADYVVSPCAVPGLIEICRDRGVAYLAGAMTPSEVLAQHRAGATAVKLFPARAAGGPACLRAIKSVFPDVPLVPTGGIACAEAADYLAAGALAVGMGSELLPQEVVARGARLEIAEGARRLLKTWSAAWTLKTKKETSNVQ